MPAHRFFIHVQTFVLFNFQYRQVQFTLFSTYNNLAFHPILQHFVNLLPGRTVKLLILQINFPQAMNDVFLSHKELKDIFWNVTIILEIFFDTIIKSYFTTTIHDFFFLHSQDVILKLVVLPVNPGADKLFLIRQQFQTLHLLPYQWLFLAPLLTYPPQTAF